MKITGTLKEVILLPLQFVRAAWRITTTRRLLLCCLIPWSIGVVCFFASTWFLLSYRDDIVLFFVNDLETWLGQTLRWIMLVLNIVISAIVAVVSMAALGAVFIQKFIEIVLSEHGVEVPQYDSWSQILKSALRCLRQELARLSILAVLAVVLAMLSLLWILQPVVVLAAVFIAGYNILDMPLSVLEMPLGRRFAVAKRHWPVTGALGIIFAPLLVIPLVGVFFAPAAYYVACERLAAWHRNGSMPAWTK